MTANGESATCIVCGTGYVSDVAGFFRCPQCGLLSSGQRAGYGNAIKGMSAIATRNYAIVAAALAKAMPLRAAKVLDVGSAEGGFTELMLRGGADCLGLEPDRDAAADAVAQEIPVELVSFEGFAGAEGKYDAIVFNDVFEHMQDPALALEKSHGMLKDGGLLLINLPVSSGSIFRAVRTAAHLGMTSPYRRIWAQGLSSPHIYFFDEANLRTLLGKYRFDFVDKGRLVALATDGMYQRVRSTYGPLSALTIGAAASLFTLISPLFPADVLYLLFRKNEQKS